ncbi:DUF3500 domain-containing protein [Planosporangium mesophilum]|uniref:DUF3500 domain-containing protein n=1 Tax=Planosporangium mesophilum TaxID=689768 RepID=A0A8J3WZK2_9ACTN|nr:DUF3500 domain-containing protein [Planosporangium mesophilum]NJC83010.1 DUF3500 domain-containing protein [Planosporangium mesophilum]GII22415.1 hypothetical protein Pme01_20120 [Planosporangium mesophilum]
MTQSTAAAMRTAAAALVDRLDEAHRAQGCHPFSDDGMRRWIEYRPQPRPGISLADLAGPARKATHRLLATGLSPHAYAQAMTIVALEEVLDRSEGWVRGRHSNDYWINVFGDPTGAGPWGWRFEGHHISVTMTVDGDRVYPTPVFLGANPATVSYAGQPVVRPLALEEDLARLLLDEMGVPGRALAVTADTAPADITSGQSARVAAPVIPLGIPAHRLGPAARELLDRLVAGYLDRLPPELARAEATRIDRRELHFAWEGPVRPGAGHYYRIQGPDLLIEYDNTQNDANHAHTVLRRPDSDFGGDVLAAHRAEAH